MLQAIPISKIKYWDQTIPLFTKGEYPDGRKAPQQGITPTTILYATSADGQKVTDGTPTEWVTAIPTVTNGDTLGIRPDLTGRQITSWADLLSPDFKGKAALQDNPTIGVIDVAMALEARGDIKYGNKGNMTKAEINKTIEIMMVTKKSGRKVNGKGRRHPRWRRVLGTARQHRRVEHGDGRRPLPDAALERIHYFVGCGGMKLSVFLPIGNNGWLISTTSPQYKPSFDLNRTIVEKAERFGLDFALSMIKLHGFGGKSEYWDYNLESFTLMSGLAAITSRIQLFATCAVLTMPPPIAARMAVTVDSISHGRFGVNIISGWQRREYTQMGIWPGTDHYLRRYDYCAEYVEIMQELWRTGRSDFKGNFFQMDDCRCLPKPAAQIPIICAAQSDAGTRYAARYADYNFCASFGVNTPTAVSHSVDRLVKANQEIGGKCSALVLIMIIADGTDAAAMAKWDHYKAGADLEALAYRDAQAEDDRTMDPYAGPNRRRVFNGGNALPTNAGVLVGSYASVARMLDEMAELPGVEGAMMTFDDFVIGMEQFGTRIQPLMKSRAALRSAA